jgi:DNA polymerase I-like protein with 3'-5' exonuclease and polymerase domains
MGADVCFATTEDLLEYFKDHTEIDFDTETEGFDPYTCKLLSAQFGDAKNQYVVDCNTISMQEFKGLLENPNICWNMQNAKFDLKFLYHQRIVPKKIFDTFLAERVLTTGLFRARKALDFLVHKYCGQTMDKTVRGNIHREGLSKRVIIYAATDVAYLGEIKRKQIAKLTEQNLLKAMQLDNLYVKVLAYIEYSGFKLDRDLWIKKMEKDYANLDKAHTALNDWIINSEFKEYIDTQLDLFSEDLKCRINWSSSKQVVEFFKKLGVDTQIKDSKTGGFKDSVDAKVIKPQKDLSPIIPIYLQYKGYEKVVSTYGNSFLKAINPVSGRIHTQFTQIMDTGRLSCGGKNRSTKEEYINFQNIPATPEDREEDMVYARDCFIPEEGYNFIVADYAGQEQIVLANQSLDKDILEFYDKELGDMHSFIASKIYPEIGDDLNQIKKNHKNKRQIAKSAGFAINYGGNGITIADNLSISQEEGEEVYESYFRAFPGLKNHFAKAKQGVLNTGYVEFNTLTKRKSYIDFFDEYKKLEKRIREYGFWDRYRAGKANDTHEFRTELRPLVKDFFKYQGMMERKSLNYPVQGTSAEITKLAGVYLFNHLEEQGQLFDTWLPNVVHDELLVECKEEYAEELAKVVKDCMEKAGARYYTRVPLKADPYIGKDWCH